MPTPGELIRTARMRAGLTQTQLAKRVGTTQAAVSRVESDGISPTVASLERFVDAAGERLHLTSVRAPTATILTPANPEWQEIEREQRDFLRPSPDTPVLELLRRGIALSRQAAKLRNAIEKAGEDAGSRA